MSQRMTFTVMVGVSVAIGAIAFQAGRSVGDEKAKPRLYELRIYTTEEGRLPALHTRFKNHTIKLFEKHGMQNHEYWVPTEQKDTLIYVVSHESKAAADASWKGFINDPEWKKAAAESEKDGKIVKKVDKWYMTLTDYSPVP